MRSGREAGRPASPKPPSGSHGERPAEPPTDFAAFCRLVQDRKIQLPRRLTEVASFLIANPEDVAFEPVARIAAKADLSASAFVRLAQHLGFSGFSQLQAIFERRLLGGSFKSAEGDGIEGDALSAMATVMANSIQRFAAHTDRIMFGRAVDLVRRARTVFVVAQTNAGHPVLAIRQALSASGIRNIPAGGSFGLIDETIAFASADDAVIVVDMPPYDRDLAPRIAQLRRRAVPIVMITDSRLHPLIAEDTVSFELRDDGPSSSTSSLSLACLAWAIADKVRRH